MLHSLPETWQLTAPGSEHPASSRAATSTTSSFSSLPSPLSSPLGLSPPAGPSLVLKCPFHSVSSANYHGNPSSSAFDKSLQWGAHRPPSTARQRVAAALTVSTEELRRGLCVILGFLENPSFSPLSCGTLMHNDIVRLSHFVNSFDTLGPIV